MNPEPEIQLENAPERPTLLLVAVQFAVGLVTVVLFLWGCGWLLRELVRFLTDKPSVFQGLYL